MQAMQRVEGTAMADVTKGMADGDVLAYHCAARERADRLGLGPLARGTRVMLWGLRAYVVFMAVVVAVQVAQTLH